MPRTWIAFGHIVLLAGRLVARQLWSGKRLGSGFGTQTLGSASTRCMVLSSNGASFAKIGSVHDMPDGWLMRKIEDSPEVRDICH